MRAACQAEGRCMARRGQSSAAVNCGFVYVPEAVLSSPAEPLARRLSSLMCENLSLHFVGRIEAFLVSLLLEDQMLFSLMGL